VTLRTKCTLDLTKFYTHISLSHSSRNSKNYRKRYWNRSRIPQIHFHTYSPSSHREIPLLKTPKEIQCTTALGNGKGTRTHIRTTSPKPMPKRRLQLHGKKKTTFCTRLVKCREKVKSYFPRHSEFLAPSVWNGSHNLLCLTLFQSLHVVISNFQPHFVLENRIHASFPVRRVAKHSNCVRRHDKAHCALS
jgi:hypothetical protein